MPLPVAPGSPGLPQSALQVMLALLLSGHLPQGLGGGLAPIGGLAGGRARTLAREPLGSLEFGLVDLIGGLLFAERVLFQIFVPAIVPLVERLLGELRVTGDEERVSLQRLVERRPQLPALGGLLLGLLLFGGLLDGLRELLLEFLHLVLEVRRSESVLARVPEVPGDVLELVPEQVLHCGLAGAIVFLCVVGARLGHRRVFLGHRVVDALVLSALLLEIALALVERLDLLGELLFGLGQVLVALELVELAQALALLLVGLFGLVLVAVRFCRLRGLVFALVGGLRGRLASGLQRPLEMGFSPFLSGGLRRLRINRLPRAGLRCRVREVRADFRLRGVRGWGLRG